MIAPLDIFAVKNDGTTWVDCAETLVRALELVVTRGDGLYFVFSQRTGHKNFYNVAQGSVVAVRETA